jgi:hypothetical protein
MTGETLQTDASVSEDVIYRKGPRVANDFEQTNPSLVGAARERAESAKIGVDRSESEEESTKPKLKGYKAKFMNALPFGIGANKAKEYDKQARVASLFKDRADNPNFNERIGKGKGKTAAIPQVGAGVALTGGVATGITAAINGADRGIYDGKVSALDQFSSGGMGAVLGIGGIASGALALKNYIGGKSRISEAEKTGDAAGKTIGESQVDNSKLGMGKAALMTASAGVKLAGAFGGIALPAAKIAGSVLGAASGAVTVLEGLYKGYHEAKSLHKLIWMKTLSMKGETWRKFIRNKKGARLAVQGAKVALGSVAIAGNIMSGGATLGAISAIGGLGMLGAKMAINLNDRKKATAARKELFGNTMEKAYDSGKIVKDHSPEEKERRKSQPLNMNPTKDNPLDRIEASNLIKRKSSESARISGEIIDVLKSNDFDEEVKQDGSGKIQALVGKTKVGFLSKIKSIFSTNEKEELERKEAYKALEILPQNQKEYYDAFELIRALKITKSEAVSPSGQELMESKISVVNSI